MLFIIVIIYLLDGRLHKTVIFLGGKGVRLRATSHSTISMCGHREMGEIQSNNY